MTCTLGEEGEVIPPELAHLAADRDDTLGQSRIGELAAAMAELGVTDHRFLGGPGRYRDSGMMGTAQNEHAPVLLAGRPRRGRRPPGGGHPRDAARRSWSRTTPTAATGTPTTSRRTGWRCGRPTLAGDPDFRPDLGAAHTVERILWICVPRSVVEEGFARLRDAGQELLFGGIASADDIPGVVGDEDVAFAIDGRAYAGPKGAAMHAHATQIAVDGPFFALSNDLGQPLFTIEHFSLVRGTPPEAGGSGGAARGPGGWAGDLFTGIGDRKRGLNAMRRHKVRGARRPRRRRRPSPGHWSRAAGSPADCCSRWPGAPRSSTAAADSPATASARRCRPLLWFVTVMYLTISRPEGDFLFTAGIGPYVYLLGGMASGVICATLPRHGSTGAPGARLGR